MFSLPDQILVRMRAIIPDRQRSKIIAVLLLAEIERREEMLYKSAMELEACEGLTEEMLDWDKNLGGDGLDEL